MKALRKGWRLMVAAMSLGAASQAAAQASQCTALLEHGISNVRTQTNDETYLSVVKDHYCNSSYDSLSSTKQGSFNAVLKTIPIGLTGNATSSRDKHSQFCKNFQSALSTTSNSYLNVVSIHDRALQAWTDCLQLASRYLEVQMTPFANNKGVDFNLLWRSTGTSKILGVDTFKMDCTLAGNKLKPSENITISPESARSIRCERNSQNVVLSGYTAEYFPDANVKIKTQEGDYRMEFADMLSGPAQTRFEKLETDVAAARAELRTYQRVLREQTGETKGAVAGEFRHGKWGPWQVCPSGSYVSAVQIYDQDTGSKCPPCIANVNLRCSGLPDITSAAN